MGMGIPRTLFRLSSIFDNYKPTDGYEGEFFFERSSAVRFTDEPGTISGEDETMPLAAALTGSSTPETLMMMHDMANLVRQRKIYSMPERSSTLSLAPLVPSNRGVLDEVKAFLWPDTSNVPEPYQHTFQDHYKMNCDELDAEDALEPIHDEMILRKAWLLLELMPMKRMWQERGKWRSTFWCVVTLALCA